MKKILLLTIVLFSFLISEGQITNPAPYCSGSFDDANGPPLPEWISKVTLGTLNNNSPDQPYPHYAYFDSVTVPDLIVGQNYTIAITFQAFNDGYAAWIDYNHDDLFDTVTEKITGNAANTPIGPGTVTKTGTFTVPINATLGITRMRVRQVNDTGYNHTHSYLIAPCNHDSTSVGIMNYGSCLDFNVNIVTSTGIPIVDDNSVSVTYHLSGTLLNIRKTSNDKVEMKIYNALGQLVKSSTLINTLSAIDVSSIGAGMYFIQFSGDKNFIMSGKFVK